MIEFSSKWQNFSPKGPDIEVSKVPEGAFETFDTSIAEALSEKISAACTCPTPSGPAGCGPKYPVCFACGYTWYCKDCGGCRQCAAPGRKVCQPDELDLPFPLGNGGLDPVQVEMAERHNTRLGVVDPLERRLNVLFWLMQHYQGIGDDEMAAEVKGAYYSLRNANPDVVRLVRVGELSEETLLKRLRNGQRWLTMELEKWATDNPDAVSDTDFQKALDGWVAMEIQLREQHGYRGCVLGEGQRCPAESVVICDACAVASSNKETRHGTNANET
jgi:hypothetical protein